MKRVRESPLDRWAIGRRQKELAVRYNQRWGEMEKSGTPLERLFKSYALYNRSEGKSSATISWYDDKLREFMRWLCIQGDSPDLGQFTTDTVREFVLHLQEREDKYERNPFIPTRREKLFSHTIQGHVRVLKAFASWLYREGTLPTMSFNVIGCPRPSAPSRSG